MEKERERVLACVRGGRRKINRCNYLQEHGGGAGRCGEAIAAQPYELSACTDDSSDAAVIITSLLL